MEYFRKSSEKDMEQYQLLTSAEVKNRVLDALIASADKKGKAAIKKSDIESWGISKHQYDKIIKEFKDRGLVEYKGYEYESPSLTYRVDDFVRKGGFITE